MIMTQLLGRSYVLFKCEVSLSVTKQLTKVSGLLSGYLCCMTLQLHKKEKNTGGEQLYAGHD